MDSNLCAWQKGNLLNLIRWVNTKDYFAPNDKLLCNTDVESEVLSVAFDFDSKFLAASKLSHFLLKVKPPST